VFEFTTIVFIFFKYFPLVRNECKYKLHKHASIVYIGFWLTFGRKIRRFVTLVYTRLKELFPLAGMYDERLTRQDAHIGESPATEFAWVSEIQFGISVNHVGPDLSQ